jgi:hypothetical protein
MFKLPTKDNFIPFVILISLKNGVTFKNLIYLSLRAFVKGNFNLELLKNKERGIGFYLSKI